MTSEGLGVMFEGDSADMCGGKFSLMSLGGRAEGLACADREARTPIGVNGNFCFIFPHHYKRYSEEKILELKCLRIWFSTNQYLAFIFLL